MRRATQMIVFAALFAGFVPVAVNAGPQTVNMVDGIGMIDYSKKPAFKVGDWVKYHLTGTSALSIADLVFEDLHMRDDRVPRLTEIARLLVPRSNRRCSSRPS